MNWIAAGFLMLACAVPAYLLIRRASLGGMPIAVQNLACFIVPLPLFIILALVSGVSLFVTGYQLAILAVSATLFSYLGAKLSLVSIAQAPNPGYSLIISKSYVLMTTIVSLLFFQSTLTVRTALAIGFIVIFSALILIDPKVRNSKRARSTWWLLALGAFFCWGMLAIASKYLLELGVPIYTLLIYRLAIVSLIMILEVKKEGINLWKLRKESKWLFIAIGLFFTGFNYFMQVGFQLAPNIGYINAMNASSIGLVVIGAAIFFHDDLTPRKFIGVLGVIAGLIILVL